MRISDWSSDVCSSDLRGQAAKQHDELPAAVARDMAMIVRNSCQRVGDRLDHAVARLVPVKVVDLLELVDVAKGDAERFGSGPRFLLMAVEPPLHTVTGGAAGGEGWLKKWETREGRGYL